MSTSPRQNPPLFSPEPAPRGRYLTVVWLLVLGAICALAFALQLYHFWPFMTDDAYISLRYSQRLLEGHGLTWNDLPHAVEGYSNLLWVLLCSALGALGMNLATAARALGITSTILGIAAVGAQVYRDFPGKVKFISALLGCLALCLSAPIITWAVAGLEAPLLSALVAWAAYFGIRWVSTPRGSSRDANITGLLLAFAVLARADAALFTALFYAGAVLADGLRVRSFITRARMLVLPILFFLGQELFRHFYYHAWLPNTAYVKVAFTFHRLYTGLRYDIYGTGSNFVFFLLAIIGAVALWIAGKKRQVIFLATASIGWLIYILIVGGDIFPAYRHFVPAMTLMGFLIAGCGLLTLAAPFRFSRIRVAIFLGLTLLVLTSDLFTHYDEKVEQGRAVGIFLGKAFGDQHPLLVSDAAGIIPFYSHFEAIDPLGLNDYHIVHHPAADRGHGWLGHELGDGPYVLDHKPDLIMPANFEGVMAFPADQQLLADPRFAHYYQLIFINAGPPDSVRSGIYIRRMDGKLGIESSDNATTIPAYLADSTTANAVRLIDTKAQLVIPPHGSARFSAIPLAAGVWKATLAGAAASQLSIQPAASTCSECIEADSSGTSTATVTNTSNHQAVLETITLTRQ